MLSDAGPPMSDRNLPQSFWNATATATSLTDMSNSMPTGSHSHPHHSISSSNHHHHSPTAQHPSMHPAAVSHHAFTTTQNMVNGGFPILAASTATAAAGSATSHHDLYPPEVAYHHHTSPLHPHHPMHHQADSTWAYSYHHRAAAAATATASAMHDHLTTNTITNNHMNMKLNAAAAAQYSSLLFPTTSMRSRFSQVTGPCSTFDKTQMAAAAAADMHWSNRYDFSSHAHPLDTNYPASAYGGAVSAISATSFHQPVN
ncbi:uncharacterized protein LOC141849691 isoform X2 [Brevipalpus obovatus]|uniref:uncharacterized protein LOC141849691 isoform X2 n=1 Tax=Brevipalpus obovatus TaxID=246614 RepID=UPI003D9DF384